VSAFYTAVLHKMKRKTSTDGKWHYHDVPYLVQHVRSGTFYVRKRWGNKIVQRSLDTTLISEAKVRLPDKLREIRDQLGTPVERDLPRLPAGYKAKDEVMALMPKSTNLDPGKATKFSEAAAIFLDAVNSDPALAERSKLVRSATLRNLLTYWTDLGDRRLADLVSGLERSVEFVLADIMTDSEIPLVDRLTIYNKLPEDQRAMVYDAAKERLSADYASSPMAQVLAFDKAYPEPPGIDAWRAKKAELERERQSREAARQQDGSERKR